MKCIKTLPTGELVRAIIGEVILVDLAFLFINHPIPEANADLAALKATLRLGAPLLFHKIINERYWKAT